MNWDLTTTLALVAAGGAIGATLRFSAGQLIDSSQFPWSTFAVNIIGSFMISLIFFSYGHLMSETVRYFLFVGIFGAFTTMATFSLETTTMFFDGKELDALMNFMMNPVLCVFGAVAARYIALAM